MSNEVAKVEQNNPYLLMMQDMVKSGNVAQLEKMMDLHQRWEADEARKAYALSFAVVQSRIGTVAKTKKNEHTKSTYSDLADIVEYVKPIYTEEGFSLIFHEGKAEKDDHIRIVADMLHRNGHKEVYYKDIPLDGAGIKGNANMTPIHGDGSATSYARRYLTCMIFNIATGDDKDGNKPKLPLLSTVKQAELIKAISESKDKPELSKAFFTAVGMARALNDKESEKMFVDEKTKKQKELEVQK